MQVEAEHQPDVLGGAIPRTRRSYEFQENATGEAPSADDLQESRATRWVLAAREDSGAQSILMFSECAVCHYQVLRTSAMNGPLLVITPWMHGFAASHPPVVKDEQQ